MNMQADGAGITAFRGLEFLQPAPLLNVIVRRLYATLYDIFDGGMP
jgi:hypothetical protein